MSDKLKELEDKLWDLEHELKFTKDIIESVDDKQAKLQFTINHLKCDKETSNHFITFFDKLSEVMKYFSDKLYDLESDIEEVNSKNKTN